MTDRAILYRRAARVTAYQAAAGKFFGDTVDGLVVEPLRIQFQIEHNLRKEPNRCEIALTNCSQATRRFLTKKPLIVLIEAGYEGANSIERQPLRRLFQGDLRFGSSVMEGTDWVTRLQLADGDRAYRHARVNRSYKAGTRLTQVLKDVAATCGLVVPANVLADPALSTAEFGTGVAMSGPAQAELTKILARYGYAWSIQDGRLQALRDEDVADGTAYVIDETAGMIGSPELSAPEKAKGKPTMSATTMLYPQIAPGCKVKVSSRDVSGVFKVERVVHTGDTFTGDFKTEIQGVPA